MSVLKSKRSTSKAEYVNLANEIYTETVAFLTRLSARYARLLAEPVAALAGEIIDRTEKANSIDPRIRAVADTVVASVPGGVGMPLGVEPSQMEMVSLPSSVDNWIACQLRAKNPAHYMDDYHMGAETKEQAEKFLQATAQRMEDMGLTVNRNKSKIVPLTKPFRFCKAKFHLTETGRIITHGCRDGMKRARRKLRFFQGEVAAGRKTVEEVARWLNDGPIAYYEQFNDHGRVLKLRRVFYAMFIKGRKTEEVKPCIGS